MTTLYFHLDEHFGATKLACPWVLRAGDGAPLAEGLDEPASWPVATRYFGIIGAARARVLRLALPALPEAKFRAALGFAVETRIAGDPSLQHIVAGEREADGKRRVVVIEEAWLKQACAQLAASGIGAPTLVAEGELPAAPDAAWWWFRAAPGGFVLMGDDLLPLDDANPQPAPPAALLLALERSGKLRPARLLVAGALPTPEQELAWARGLGLAIESVSGWSWRNLPEARYGEVLALALPARPASLVAQQATPWRTWRLATWLFLAALGLQISATVIDYARLRWRVASLEREAGALLRERFSGVEAKPTVFAAFRAQYARARHGAGLAAAQDALPLLARATPALALLGESALRQAHYASGRWTLDLAPQEPALRQRLATALALAGLQVLDAEQGGGLRVMLQESEP
ncbi:MAG: hypothetical protein HYZ17_09170 [Betaproteobacteria bacterium]|nr:hypothetical protein [Betaproteobacteria bacterium]